MQLVIGDIHGCYAELQQLLELAGLGEEDEIIAVGDLVDRGPDPGRVLDFFREHPRARSLLGNHERKHLRSFAGEIRPALSQKITRQQLGEAAYRDAISFMHQLPRSIVLDSAIVVHGFWEPGVPLADQRDQVVVGTLTGEHYLDGAYDRPWYELYDGPKPLVVGHRDYLRNGTPFVYEDRVYGIDTCVYGGGALTGILLPHFELLTVPSPKNYWAITRSRYPDLEDETPDERLTWDRLESFLRGTEGRNDLSRRALARRRNLLELRRESTVALEELTRRVLERHDAILSHLREEVEIDELTSAECGRLFARHLLNSPLAQFVHLARQGRFDHLVLKRRFKTPQKLLQFLHRLDSANQG